MDNIIEIGVLEAINGEGLLEATVETAVEPSEVVDGAGGNIPTLVEQEQFVEPLNASEDIAEIVKGVVEYIPVYNSPIIVGEAAYIRILLQPDHYGVRVPVEIFTDKVVSSDDTTGSFATGDSVYNIMSVG